jgi:ribonuclease HI
MKHVTIYTDGACLGNPGPGGWGAILTYNDAENCISGSAEHTTNNRMEMMAVIQGLSALKERCSIELYTDSKYVKDGCETWMTNWIKNNWLTASKQPVKNQDLWMELHTLFQFHDIKLFWVKGHSGNIMNERVDKLAGQAIQDMLADK